MRREFFARTAFLVLFLLLAAMLVPASQALAQAAESIYLDESFDGASYFADLNWPIQDTKTTVALGQGINLRRLQTMSRRESLLTFTSRNTWTM